MDRKSSILLGLLLFNGLSAAGGGLALMSGWIPEQAPGSGTPTSPATTSRA